MFGLVLLAFAVLKIQGAARRFTRLFPSGANNESCHLARGIY